MTPEKLAELRRRAEAHGQRPAAASPPPSERIAELRRRAEAHGQLGRAERDRLATHRAAAAPSPRHRLPFEVARAFGVNSSQVDMAAPYGGVLDRAWAGLASDNPTEEAKLVSRTLPPGGRALPVGDFVGVQLPGSDTVQLTNLPGADWYDMAHFAGGAAPAIAAGLATGGAGLLVGAGAQMATEGARELGQAALDVQDETPLSYGARIGAAGLGEVVPPGLAKGLGAVRKKLRGAGLDMPADELMEAVKLADEGFDDVQLRAYQQSDSKVLRTLADQVFQLTGKDLPYVRAQLKETRRAYDDLVAQTRKYGPPDFESPDYMLQRIKKNEYERRRNMLQPVGQPAEAGTAVMDLVHTPSRREGPPGALNQRRSRMTQEFRTLREIADRENPVFDIAASQEALRPRAVMGEGLPVESVPSGPPGLLVSPDGTPLIPPEVTAESIRDAVDVGASPDVRLSQVARLAHQLDPRQSNFEVVKELRSQLGKFYELPAAVLAEGGVRKSEVDRAYQALTEDMVPVNADRTPGFVAQLPKADEAARQRYAPFEYEEVHRALSARPKANPEKFWASLAESPTTWSKAFRGLLEEGDKAKLAVVKENLQYAIAQSDDPVSTLQKFRSAAPDTPEWIYGSKEAVENAIDSGRALRELNSSLGKKAFDRVSEERGFARYALEDRYNLVRPGESPEDAATRLVRESGGEESLGHLALRNAAIEPAFKNALRFNKQAGEYGLHPEEMRKGIKEMERKGWWDAVLTESDRKRLSSLATLSEEFWKTGNAGTALTIAAEVSGLRGTQGLTGAAKAYVTIRAANIMSTLFTMPAIPDKLLVSKLPVVGSRATPLGEKQISQTLQWLARGLRGEMPSQETEQPSP